MSIAQAILGAVAAARPIAASARIDAYELVRPVRTADGEGGWTEMPTVIEAGSANLIAIPVRPVEGETTDRESAVVQYEVRNMPYNSLVTADDTITIGGRVFQVVGVRRAAQANVAVTAVCQERS